MTTPSIVAAPFVGAATDYKMAKVDREGCVRLTNGSVTVPASTASGTVIGLVPFNKGAALGAARIIPDDLDTTNTTVTLDFGYVYDDNVTFTDAPAAFVSADTGVRTGVAMTTAYLKAANTWVAAADGWLVVKTGGGATTTAGAVTFSIELAYDQ